jgi:hypothetical protein
MRLIGGDSMLRLPKVPKQDAVVLRLAASALHAPERFGSHSRRADERVARDGRAWAHSRRRAGNTLWRRCESDRETVRLRNRAWLAHQSERLAAAERLSARRDLAGDRIGLRLGGLAATTHTTGPVRSLFLFAFSKVPCYATVIFKTGKMLNHRRRAAPVLPETFPSTLTTTPYGNER